jgi:metal-responsive CopG/Arc/MetJ family transcriptional regulator
MYQKVTLTLPESVVKKLNELIPKGKRSEFVAKNLEAGLSTEKFNKILRRDRKKVFSEIARFAKENMHKSLTGEEVQELIDRDRP